MLWAIAASLLATLVFIANPVRLHLTRESMLGFVFLASGAGAVIVGDRITQDAHDLAAILFGSAVVVQTERPLLVGGGDGDPAGRPPGPLAGAALRRLRPDGRARAGHAGARAQRLPLPVGRAGGRAMHAGAGRAAGVRVQRAARDGGAGAHVAHSVVFVLATVFGALSGVAGYAVSFRGELPVGATQTALAAAFVGAAMFARFLVRVLRRNGDA